MRGSGVSCLQSLLGSCDWREFRNRTRQLLAKYFIIQGGNITCKVTGKRQRSKMLRGGLEVPCKYIFTIEGKSAVIQRLKDKLRNVAKTW